MKKYIIISIAAALAAITPTTAIAKTCADLFAVPPAESSSEAIGSADGPAGWSAEAHADQPAAANAATQADLLVGSTAESCADLFAVSPAESSAEAIGSADGPAGWSAEAHADQPAAANATTQADLLVGSTAESCADLFAVSPAESSAEAEDPQGPEGWSIALKNSTLAEALREIASQTGLEFFYDAGQVAQCQKIINIEIRRAPIDEILDEILQGTGLTWKIDKNTIVITPVKDEKTAVIEGRIYDNFDNTTVPGVTVYVEGTKIGTYTDADGHFSLELPAEGCTVTFSSIGYKTRSLKFTGSNAKDFTRVSIEQETMQIADVVVTGIYAAVYLLYDVDNKKFMGYCPLLSLSQLGGHDPLQEMEGLAEIGDAQNESDAVVELEGGFTDWPESLDFVYMENTRYDPGNASMGVTYTVLADGDRRYVYGIQCGDMLFSYGDCTYVLGKAVYADISSCTEIVREDNLFAFSSLRNYMYYTAGNAVYRADLSASPVVAELQFELPGEEITCMKFNLYRNSENSQDSYDLVVASVNASGAGILRIYEGYDSVGDFAGAEPVEVYLGDGENPFTRIVDVEYKERVF